MIIKLARKSLWDRKVSVFLTTLAVVISITLLISVEQIRQQTRNSFSRTVSGVELIVGSRTSQINLLLASVFRIGELSNGISWQTYEKLRSQAQVKWTVPIALGDSHKGYAVVGTDHSFYDYYQYSQKKSLTLEAGQWFSGSQQVVIGANVAKQLGYQLGDSLILSHGTGKVSFSHHAGRKFKVVGILNVTATPVDKALYIGLGELAALHNEHSEVADSADNAKHHHQQPIDSISAVFMALESPIGVLTMQRYVNQFTEEPLTGIIPGVALNQLWGLMSQFEQVLFFISVLVFVSALLATAIMLLASIGQRKQEIKVLRIMGASPGYIFFLIQVEALLISFSGIVISMLLVMALGTGLSQWLNEMYGIIVNVNLFTDSTLYLLFGILIASMGVSSLPALGAFRMAK